jgi:hypothetical protein
MGNLLLTVLVFEDEDIYLWTYGTKPPRSYCKFVETFHIASECETAVYFDY